MKKEKKLRRRGFTLIELIVAMAILIIVVGGIAMLLEPSMRVYSEGANLSRAKRMADDISELMLSEFLYAKDVRIDVTWEEEPLNELGKQVSFVSPSYGKMTLTQSTPQEILLVQESSGKALGFGTDYFMRNGAKVGITSEGSQITITVCMIDKAGEVILTKERTAKRLNLP